MKKVKIVLWDENMKDNLIRIAIILAGLLILAGLVFGVGFVKKYYLDWKNRVVTIDTTAEMEKYLGVENIITTETSDGTFEVRVKMPHTNDKNILVSGAIYMFGNLEGGVNENIKKFKSIYTVNAYDAIVFEALRTDIIDWKNKKIDDKGFIARVKINDLRK